MAEWTDEQRDRIYLHLEYPGADVVIGMFTGVPLAMQIYSAAPEALRAFKQFGVPYVLELLAAMDNTLRRMWGLADSAEASAVGDLRLRPDADAFLMRLYRRQQTLLAQRLGVWIWPFDTNGNPRTVSSASGVNGTWSR